MRVFVVDNDLKSGKVEFRVETVSTSESEEEVVVGVMRVGGSRGQAGEAGPMVRPELIDSYCSFSPPR